MRAMVKDHVLSRQVKFTVAAEGIALPVAGYTLPPGIYTGAIAWDGTGTIQATISLSPQTMRQLGMDGKNHGPFWPTTSGRLDITIDYRSGSIREDRQ